MRIRDLPIPKDVSSIIEWKGIDTLYPPQRDALTRSDVLKGRNLLLATPTASGKTLVAEICGLKHVYEGKGKILYLTPLRALAFEKYREFKIDEELASKLGWRLKVALTVGDYDSEDRWLSNYDWIVTTNEKCDSLIRHKAPWLKDVSLLVVDEIHYINDPDRGPTLEVLLTKIRYYKPNTQILALSATVRNVEEIARWLDADYVVSNWRPVKLTEGVVYGGQVIYSDGCRSMLSNRFNDPILDVAVDTIRNGGQILVFTNTRKNAVSTARKLSGIVYELLTSEERVKLRSISKMILETGETRLPNSDILSELIRRGTAFHHAGLHNDHRSIVEDYFRSGLIKALAATPTLAAGVNLPARVVVISSYYRFEPDTGYNEISVMEYKQMAGRAGRPRYDKEGLALLIAKDEDEVEYLMDRYILAEAEILRSKLRSENVLRSHILGVIASEESMSMSMLLRFFSRSLFAKQNSFDTFKQTIDRILDFLSKHRMVEFDGSNVYATKLGKRVSELYIDPLSAVILEKSLRIVGEPTIFTLLYTIASMPDLEPKLYPSRAEVSKLEQILDSKYMELPLDSEWYTSVGYIEALAYLKTALTLEAWIEEEGEERIYELFNVEPGDLFRLTSTASWLLYASSELSPLIGYSNLSSVLKLLKDRMEAGVKPELLPLVKLEGVGRVRARNLYKAGFKDLESLRNAKVEDLVKIPSIGIAIANRIIEQVKGIV
ncbi:MAG: DEAD/DEAH box helicase [Candidatus Bathyarchaeia archaeon]|nr:DEAD/DEAH box helicase [Candidatus Bathyarchaeota archaeon]